MVDEAESDPKGTIGIDPEKSILWAQVREGQPQMSIDIEGRLRPSGIKGNCSRCRSGKYCPLPGHLGNIVQPERQWQGPESVDKRQNKKNPAKK